MTTKMVFALLFIGGIALMLRGKNPWEPFSRIQIPWLLASIALSVTMVGASCFKWRILLCLQKQELPFFTMLRIYFIGYLFSNLPTSNLGGDMVRSYYAGERIQNHGDAAVSVFLERFTGLLLLLLLAMLGPLVQPELYRHPAIIIPVCIATLLLVVIVVLIFTDKPLNWGEAIGQATAGRLPVIGPLFTKIMGKVRGFHGKLRLATTALLRQPVFLLPVIGLTVLFYAATWLNIYISFKAFDVDPSWIGILAVTAVSMLAGILPLGGFGLIEFSMIYYFSLAGFATDDSFAMSFLLRLKVILLGTVGLFFYLTGTERKQEVRLPDPAS